MAAGLLTTCSFICMCVVCCECHDRYTAATADPGRGVREREGLDSQLGLEDRLSAGARTALLLVIIVCVFCCIYQQQVGRRTTAIHLILSCSNISSGSSAGIAAAPIAAAATERGSQGGRQQG